MTEETLLSDREEQTLRLVREQGMSKQEAADEMDITYGSVDTYFSRANEKIRKAENTVEEHGGYDLEVVVQGTDIGVGRATRYEGLLIVRLSPQDCSADYAACDCYTRNIIDTFDSDDFTSEDDLREWLDEVNEDYWGPHAE